MRENASVVADPVARWRSATTASMMTETATPIVMTWSARTTRLAPEEEEEAVAEAAFHRPVVKRYALSR